MKNSLTNFLIADLTVFSEKLDTITQELEKNNKRKNQTEQIKTEILYQIFMKELLTDCIIKLQNKIGKQEQKQMKMKFLVQ